jgi:hypothetical protein
MSRVQPSIRTRTEYAAQRASCSERLVMYIISGERKGKGPVGKRVKAALREYDSMIARQMEQPLEVTSPHSSS